MAWHMPEMRTADQPDSTLHMTRGGWRIVLLASLGGTLEFYDFVIFGIFAKDIADAIFPNPTPLISLMVSFAAFAAGYLARPIGGIVLSHFGDRYGRRRVFLISIFVMSGATLGMGLVPSFASWGAAASAADGVAPPGAGILPRRRTARRAHLRRRDGAAACAVRLRRRVRVRDDGRGACDRRQPRGAHLAAGRSSCRVGWRIAFVSADSAACSVSSSGGRSRSRRSSRASQCASRQPFREVLRTHRAAGLVGCAVLAATAGFNGLFLSHMPAYMSGVLHTTRARRVFSQTVGVVVSRARHFRAGWLADRIAPRYLLRAGASLLTLLAFPFYTALAGTTST